MKSITKIAAGFGICLLIGLSSVQTAQAAPIIAGTKIGIDLGPTPTTNWNNITSNTTIGAGSVTDLNGTAVDGVSISTSGFEFFNNDGGHSNPLTPWAGLSTEGGSAPSEFVDSVITDLGGNYQNPQSFSVAIDGLDKNFLYDIVAVTVSWNGFPARTDIVTLSGATISPSSSLHRPTALADGLFHAFTDFEVAVAHGFK